jgi:hypothetical protein
MDVQDVAPSAERPGHKESNSVGSAAADLGVAAMDLGGAAKSLGGAANRCRQIGG